VSPVRYGLYLYVPYGSHSKQRLFPHTALTGWALYRRRNVLSVRYFHQARTASFQILSNSSFVYKCRVQPVGALVTHSHGTIRCCGVRGIASPGCQSVVLQKAKDVSEENSAYIFKIEH
jgi:hypothetical protein